MEIRRLQKSDLEKNGFLSTLGNLSTVGIVSMKRVMDAFGAIERNPNHHVFVAVEDGDVVGSVTLLVEQKFIHHCGIVGHVEDVVVHPDFRDRGIATALIQKVIELAGQWDCYKVILECKTENVPLYEKSGFRVYETGMRVDAPF